MPRSALSSTPVNQRGRVAAQRTQINRHLTKINRHLTHPPFPPTPFPLPFSHCLVDDAHLAFFLPAFNTGGKVEGLLTLYEDGEVALDMPPWQMIRGATRPFEFDIDKLRVSKRVRSAMTEPQ